jgi:hypothetical protein
MRKRTLFTATLLLSAGLAFGQSAGGGICFFFPESLLEGSGSVSKESGFSTSLGLGDMLSVPIGFTYIKASGFLPYSDTDGDGSLERMDSRIWYVADTFIPYLRLNASIELGALYLEGFGGVAGAWVLAPQAFEGAIGQYYPASGVYVFEGLKSDFGFGYGYQLGAAAGIKIDAISVGLEAVFTDLSAQVGLDGGYTHYDGAGSSTGTISESFTARLRGLSLGIIGSFEF